MSNQRSLLDLLRDTNAVLVAARKSIAVSGHLDEMVEIDTLLAVARTETEKRIAFVISRQRPGGD